MKRQSIAIAILAVLLLCGVVCARVVEVVGQSVPAAGGGSWYYSGTGTGDSDYPNAYTGLQAYHLGAPITISSGGTVTKLAAKLNPSGTSGAYTICLLDGSNNVLASASGTTTAGSSPYWAEVAVNYAISSGTYRVIASGARYDLYISYKATSGGYYYTHAYDGTCAFSATGSDYEYATKMWVQ